jgi:hypothetical protein
MVDCDSLDRECGRCSDAKWALMLGLGDVAILEDALEGAKKVSQPFCLGTRALLPKIHSALHPASTACGEVFTCSAREGCSKANARGRNAEIETRAVPRRGYSCKVCALAVGTPVVCTPVRGSWQHCRDSCASRAVKRGAVEGLHPLPRRCGPRRPATRVWKTRRSFAAALQRSPRDVQFRFRRLKSAT